MTLNEKVLIRTDVPATLNIKLTAYNQREEDAKRQALGDPPVVSNTLSLQYQPTGTDPASCTMASWSPGIIGMFC